MNKYFAVVICVFACIAAALAQSTPRARDLSIPFDGTSGALNAITDVKGVEVGHTTLVSGSGKLQVGIGPVRTGVTAVLPRGHASVDPVFAAWFTLNGNGEMTGTTWVEESGFLEGPVMITNTHSVGVVRDAVIAWQMKIGHAGEAQPWSLPVVAETLDGWLNDVNGFHVKPEHVFRALDTAHGGPVEEGNVGGGTGMICNGFKGGIGTASRVLVGKAGGYSVGVLVQCNYGSRSYLRIAGVPLSPYFPEDRKRAASSLRPDDLGSIIIVVATDAPVLPHQLKRMARRASLGLGRNGAISGNGSGDIFIAFSTANLAAAGTTQVVPVQMLPNDLLNPLFEATVQATEEAVVNAMIAAQDMTGIDDHFIPALPKEKLRDALRQHGRLAEPTRTK